MEAIDALDEVNADRAKKGLHPFQRDDLLTEGAKRLALYRAEFLIEGHTRSDFDFLPPGATAKATGAGALTDDWGWQACCSFEDYEAAGAAWARGRDGKRYMSIVVR